VLAAGLVFPLNGLAAFGDTPSGEGSTRSPTLGYISRATRGLPNAPQINRYLNAIRSAVAEAGGVSTIDVAHDPSVPVETLALCHTAHLIGYIEPTVGFGSVAGTTIAGGQVRISDCRGGILYANLEQQSEATNPSQEGTAQIDELEARASRALGRAISSYVSAHQTGWQWFLRGGESFESAADKL